MTIHTRAIGYDGPGGPFEGIFAWDDAVAGPLPGVMVAPNVYGLKDFDVEKAKALVARGHVAFAIDVYGIGKRADGDLERGRALMGEALADRAVLKARLFAALEAMRTQPEVDAARTAAIGFCFGGKCVLDLARAGADLDGVASFHGLFDAPPFPNAPITAKVLVLHGFDDPMATPEQATELGRELTASGADFQIMLYGNAGHGFTAHGSPIPGVGYEERADKRSWRAMCDFLDELWG